MFNNKFNTSWKIWGIAFLYTCVVSVFIQFILLPILLPRLHAGGGLFAGCPDCVGFNRIAVSLAQKIKALGWSVWQLRPHNHAPAGLASIVYALTWTKLWTLIPFNAAMHASAFLILFQLVNLFLKDKNRSFLCALPFLIFPSNLQWIAQLHKDGFSILGVLLFLYAIVSLSRLEIWKDRNWYLIVSRSLIFYVGGIFLILLVRPFLIVMMRLVVLPIFSLTMINFVLWARKGMLSWKKIILVPVYFLIIFIILLRVNADFMSDDLKEIHKTSLLASPTHEISKTKAQKTVEPVLAPVVSPPLREIVLSIKSNAVAVAVVGEESIKIAEPVPHNLIPAAVSFLKDEAPVIVEDVASVVEKDVSPVAVKDAVVPVIEEKKILVSVIHKISEPEIQIESNWIRTPWLPFFIESKIYALAQTRRAFRFSGVGAKSNIDHDIGFNSVRSVFFYLPRAAQIVLLAPFPNQWLAQGSSTGSSFMRKISAFEMTVIYFALIFLPFALWYWRKRVEIWIISIFCIFMMLIYSLVVCNVGTLYRMRYPYITILTALGLAGFFVFLDKFIFRRKGSVS